MSPTLAGQFFTTEPPGKPKINEYFRQIFQKCSLSFTFPATSSSFVSFNIYLNWYYLCGEGNGTPLQYSCLENPMDGGAWWAAVHGVTKSQTQLSDFTFTSHFHALEKEMATHSSILAWRIPGTGEPGGLLSMGSHRVGHDWSDLAAAATACAENQNAYPQKILMAYIIKYQLWYSNE